MAKVQTAEGKSSGQREGRLLAGLPYIDNIRIILLTAAINLAAAFLFFYRRPLTVWSVLVDAGIFGMVTAFIDVFIVSGRVKKLRLEGRLPGEAPRSRLMSKLPKHPLLLSFALGVVFGLIAPLFNALVLRFYEVEAVTFARFAVWRVLYSTVFSAKIVELAILRYVQPDCATDSDARQQGMEKVKNPLPRVSTFKEWLNTVTDDFGFNMLFGLLLGGTIIRDHSVIIPPTTRAGIAISALILGAIVTARMAYPIAKNMRDAREGGGLPASEAEDRRVSWIPASPAGFALTLLLPIMGVSLLAFWAVFTFFGFEKLDFFQYFVIRMLFVSLLTKPVVRLAVLRYTQPMAGRRKGMGANGQAS